MAADQVLIDREELSRLRDTNIKLAKLKSDVRYAAIQADTGQLSDAAALENIREALREERQNGDSTHIPD